MSLGIAFIPHLGNFGTLGPFEEGNA